MLGRRPRGRRQANRCQERVPPAKGRGERHCGRPSHTSSKSIMHFIRPAAIRTGRAPRLEATGQAQGSSAAQAFKSDSSPHEKLCQGRRAHLDLPVFHPCRSLRKLRPRSALPLGGCPWHRGLWLAQPAATFSTAYMTPHPRRRQLKNASNREDCKALPCAVVRPEPR